MAKKEKPVKGRDWNAVDAHFRRGGPMKHKNTLRGGAKKNDPEIEEALEEMEDKRMSERWTNYTAMKCARCGKEVKRLTEGMICPHGNPSYCNVCNDEVQNLPN